MRSLYRGYFIEKEGERRPWTYSLLADNEAQARTSLKAIGRMANLLLRKIENLGDPYDMPEDYGQWTREGV